MKKSIQSLQNVVSLSVEKNSTLELDIKSFTHSNKVEFNNDPVNGLCSIVRDKIVYIPTNNFTGSDYFSVLDGDRQTILFVINVNDIVFKPRARLLIQLGNQLIKNENIALIELVKNSYDADASKCKIILSDVDKKNIGSIIIEDDGVGMDISTIKNTWLEPGSDNKEKIVSSRSYSSKGRLPIGEKGIGRFGVHKLGFEIELVTKKSNSKEVVVNVNWKHFEEYKYLDQAPISLLEREPEVFSNTKTGTRITIKNLSKNWTRTMVREAFRAINAISIPSSYHFDTINKTKSNVKNENIFETDFITDKNEWIKDIPGWKEITEYALFFFEMEISKDEIKKFKYHFKPWKDMPIAGRVVDDKNKYVSKLLEIMDTTERKAIPLSVPENQNIGVFSFSGCIFIRDLPILKLYSGKNPKTIKDYLDENGGIRIYRNGLRVYDYGEKENDWLDLDYRRFNDPGVKISNNLMLASINLSREQSQDLIEKTNREGFIENDAYLTFKKQILYALKLIEILRLEDKKKIDNTYKKLATKFEPVAKSIDQLKLLINSEIKNEELKKNIITHVNTIERNYKFMNDTLVKSASVGLGWSVYIHEIEKIISEVNKISKRENASDRLLKLIEHLSNLIESYAQILRKTSRTDESIIKIIDQAVFNVDFRLKAHNIEVIPLYKNYKGNENIKVTRNLVVANIMNIIDNSIYWLDRSAKRGKKILIDISLLSDNYLSVIISDNGTGFALPTTEITEPFVSAKPGGMGLGLHIVKEVMESQEGRLSFNENNEYPTPKTFSNGASVILSFKK